MARPIWRGSTNVDSVPHLTGQRRGARRRDNLRATRDGIGFLDSIQRPIDWLYLDRPHPGKEHGRQWAVDAFVAALPRLPSNALLLIDDIALPGSSTSAMKNMTGIRSGLRPIPNSLFFWRPNMRTTLARIVLILSASALWRAEANSPTWDFEDVDVGRSPPRLDRRFRSLAT